MLLLAASTIAAGNSYAQQNNAAEDSEPLVPAEFVSAPIYSDIELGLGYVSDDAYFFGRYNGLQTRGAYLVGNIDAEDFYEDGRYWRIHGTNLGLESRYLRLEGGKQGRHKFFLEWDELPNYMNNTARTPFSGIGSDNLSLPPGFDINTDLDANLGLFELQTKRERVTAGASFVPKQRWQFDIDFSHENKQGAEAIGAPIANGASQVVGNTTTSLLPEPIDYDTDLVNATLSYAGDQGQVDLSYHASFFNNTYASLSWDDPFTTTTGVEASMALAPDNEFHQLALTGGYSLPYRSRLTGVLSMGRMTQNQNFQPYSVGGSTPTRSSLDGEVWLTNAQLKLSSRPTTPLRLNAELRYDERDNRTPVDSYTYVVLDSHAGSTIQNNPYSYKKNRVKLEANYRFNAISSLRGGYKYDGMKRDYVNAERRDTDENTLFAKWKVKPHSTVDLDLYAEAGSRDGSEYNPLPNENLLLRKYHLADRDRSLIGAQLDYMATDRLFLGARADYNQEDFANTAIGLTEATRPVVTVDFTYQPRSNITSYGYYTWESSRSSQNGFDLSPSSTGAWQTDFDDRYDTVGLGAKWTDIGKWDIGADLVYSKASGHIEMKDLANPGTEDQFPDTRTELTSLKLWTNYNHNKQLTYKLGYWFEDYRADNWAVDGLQPYDPTVVANTLLLGNQTMDYNVHVVSVSAIYKFQ